MTSRALVELDHDALRAAIGRHPVLLRHQLTGHPALSRAALTELAADHPANLVEHHRADLPLVLPTGETESLSLSAREFSKESRATVVGWCSGRSTG